MDVRKAMRRSVPLVLLGAAATVVLRKRLQPRPALLPGEPSVAYDPSAPVMDVASVSAAIAAHSAAVVATGQVPTAEQDTASAIAFAEATPERSEGRFVRRLRRAPIDIVTVVDDLLGAAR